MIPKLVARRLLLIVTLLAPLTVSSTSSIDQYMRLYVGGHVTSDSLARLDQYVVVLLVNGYWSDEYEILEASKHRNTGYIDTWVSFTDTTGAFRLGFTSARYLCNHDSLAVGILFPNQIIVLGEPFTLDSVSPEKDVVTGGSDGFFCSSEFTISETYHYRYPDQTIALPDSI